MPRSAPFDWTDDAIAFVDLLRSQGKTLDYVAVELAKKFGRPITVGTIRYRLDTQRLLSVQTRPAETSPSASAAATPAVAAPSPESAFTVEADLLSGDTLETEPVLPEHFDPLPEPEEPAPFPSAAAGKPRFDPLPPSGLHIEELIEHRVRRYKVKDTHERARVLIPVSMPDDLPIGILHFGDPHLDDDGCDLALVKTHGDLVKNTPGLYAATVGDITNNWIGRLSALYGSQATTEHEAWRLAEWFIRDLIGEKWLYLVKGNHDAWSGVGDPLDWICAGLGAMVQDSEIRIALRFPGDREVRIKCRHSFPGSSIYNDAHGPMRALLMGQRDHVAVCGHVHKSAHAELKDSETGITMHALQVGAYKNFDHYAREKGFPDRMLGPCALTVIDPRLAATAPDQVKIFWDPVVGAKYLTMLRSGM